MSGRKCYGILEIWDRIWHIEWIWLKPWESEWLTQGHSANMFLSLVWNSVCLFYLVLCGSSVVVKSSDINVQWGLEEQKVDDCLHPPKRRKKVILPAPQIQSWHDHTVLPSLERGERLPVLGVGAIAGQPRKSPLSCVDWSHQAVGMWGHKTLDLSSRISHEK